MAFIPEDGTGLVAGANSYCSVAEANDYHADRGNSAWEAVAEPEQLLIKATDFMLGLYRTRWKGYRKYSAQPLDWPRTFVYLEAFWSSSTGNINPALVSDSIVPQEVKNACAELALRAASGALMPDQKRGKRSVTIGPLTIVYDTNDQQQPRYRQIDTLLAPYLEGSPINARLLPSG